MNMTMTILMTMNIYITPTNQERLRKEASMSGLINGLLKNHYANKAPKARFLGEDITKIAPSPVERNMLDSLPITTADKLVINLCKHGSHPKYCKHAKNGKACK